MEDAVRTEVIKSHVTANEKVAIIKRARTVHMTNSDYIRHIIVNYRIPRSIVDANAIGELFVVNADLARLGNLFRLAIDEASGNVSLHRYYSEMESLFTEMREAQKLLKQKILGLKTTS